ncbi:MAG: autotransporter-associated beta strand repeat-containing protein, partial [Verrucomicrobiota bacterium]
MNMSNPSATSPATREFKPLHPFLRLVALLLAVALTLTGPVPMALAATTDSVTVTTSGSLNITNLAQSGTILTVVAGGSLADGTSITLAKGTITSGTLSLTSLIFSGTSAFQNKDVNLSVLSNLQLAAGGSLTVPNGMSISYGPSSGILLGGSSAVINVGSSSTQGGNVGAPGGEIRVDNVFASRSTLTVNTGTVTADVVSAAYLDLGAKLDLVKNGRGSLNLSLNSDKSVLNGGSLSVFSGTTTVTAGTLLVGDNFLSDGTSNSLKLTPATSNTSFPVIVALQGYTSVSSLLTSGGSASNVILGVSTDVTSGQLVVSNAATDASIFKGVLADAVDGSEGFKMYVVKNGDGSLLLSGSSSFTGGLTLNAGTLIVNGNSTSTESDGTTTILGPLGGGPLNLRGGTLKIQPPTLIVSTGSVDANGDPILDQFGNQIIVTTTQRDPLILLHNSVSFFNAKDEDVAAGGSLILRKVTFASESGTDTLTLAGVMDLDSDARVTSGGSVTLVVNTPTVISGAITGDPIYGSSTGGSSTMSLVKSGSAQLTLSGGNQYLGDFTVAQGTLLLGSTGALGINDPDLGTFSMNSLTVSSGGVLDLGGLTQSASVPLILSGTGAGSGALTNSGADASTYSGSLTLAAASSIGGAGDITLSGSVAGAYNLTKLGTNILTFGGTSTFSGSLLVSTGTAQVGSGGTLEFASAGGLVGNLVNNGVLRFNNSADRTVTGTISGTGSLVKVGAY